PPTAGRRGYSPARPPRVTSPVSFWGYEPTSARSPATLVWRSWATRSTHCARRDERGRHVAVRGRPTVPRGLDHRSAQALPRRAQARLRHPLGRDTRVGAPGRRRRPRPGAPVPRPQRPPRLPPHPRAEEPLCRHLLDRADVQALREPEAGLCRRLGCPARLAEG